MSFAAHHRLASGSDALLLALMAHDVGPGDEVLMPSYTFFATASAAWRLGAKPVFVDIEPTTFNLNCRLLESLITPATKAIVPVHLFGQCADMPGTVTAIATRRRLAVIEDAAQAIGAEFEGRREAVGATSAASAFIHEKPGRIWRRRITDHEARRVGRATAILLAPMGCTRVTIIARSESTAGWIRCRPRY